MKNTEMTNHTELYSEMTPEQANSVKWYSSNSGDSFGEKTTVDGKKIFGLYLSTNPGYAQTYSRKTRQVNIFNLSEAKLKPTTFDYGISIDGKKREEILSQGYDGIIFEGMNGPEVALLTGIAKFENQIKPIPEGFQSLVDSRKQIPKITVDEYGIPLPEGYKLVGDNFVFEK